MQLIQLETTNFESVLSDFIVKNGFQNFIPTVMDLKSFRASKSESYEITKFYFDSESNISLASFYMGFQNHNFYQNFLNSLGLKESKIGEDISLFLPNFDLSAVEDQEWIDRVSSFIPKDLRYKNDNNALSTIYRK